MKPIICTTRRCTWPRRSRIP